MPKEILFQVVMHRCPECESKEAPVVLFNTGEFGAYVGKCALCEREFERTELAEPRKKTPRARVSK